MEHSFHVTPFQLMELAGYHSACFIRHTLQHNTDASVTLCCGTGNNGGDGLVTARYLLGWGFDVTVCIAHSDLSPLPLRHLLAIEKLDCDPVLFDHIDDSLFTMSDILVDAIFGIGLNRAPSGVSASVIDEMNRSGTPIIALDIPSGMDANTGHCHSPTIVAQATLTFGFPKAGFIHPSPVLGTVLVADIGFHDPLKKKIGLSK